MLTGGLVNSVLPAELVDCAFALEVVQSLARLRSGGVSALAV
jgi:hypothetical protein